MMVYAMANMMTSYLNRSYSNIAMSVVFFSGALKLVQWDATPKDFLVRYNSSFEIYAILQGLPFYRVDLENLDWRTQKWSSAHAQKSVSFEAGYAKPFARYPSMLCSNSGYHRLVTERPDYTQFTYRFPNPVQLSGECVIL